MMLELNRYFHDSNDITYTFYYLYFDVLLKKEKKDTSKDVKEILKDLAIQFSTYRREKLECNKRKPTIALADIIVVNYSTYYIC